MTKAYAIMLAALVCASCASGAPLRNAGANAADISASAGKAVSVAGIGEAVSGAAAAKGWKTTQVGEGRLKAFRSLGNRSATVFVDYSADGYAISYAGSTNMNFDASGNTIHPKYNKWVAELDREIRKRLM